MLPDLHNSILNASIQPSGRSAPEKPRDSFVAGIYVLGNYRRDGQRSMLRFAELLERELVRRGWIAKILQPPEFAGRLAPTVGKGVGKWLAYLDKHLAFGLQLRRMAARAPSGSVFHICDHSNAPYAAHLGTRPVVVTVHDLLAVRGGLGDTSAMCPASRTGKILQRYIFRHLREIPTVACDSDATRRDYLRLTQKSDDGTVATIPLAAEPAFKAMTHSQALQQLQNSQPELASAPFLLHVGSSQPRKNREACIELLRVLQDRWNGTVAFAGEPLTAAQRRQAAEARVGDRIVEVARPDDETLRALYSVAHALVFPSHAEGFGWPILEAQACGCPVITSNRTSLPEVAGAGGLLFEPHDTAGMATAVLRLMDADYRGAIAAEGLRNAGNFTVDRLIDSYCELYHTAVASSAHAWH